MTNRTNIQRILPYVWTTIIVLGTSTAMIHCGGTPKVENQNAAVESSGPIKTDPHLGMVFPSVKIFISTALTNMKDDKNLHIVNDPKREEFVWLRDESSDQHPWLYLFRKMSNGVVRFVLFIPGAKEVTFTTESEFPDVYTFDWTPGYPKPSAVFKYKPDMAYYIPEQCEETFLDIPKGTDENLPADQLEAIAAKKKRDISCHELFLNYGDVKASLK